MKKKVWVDIGNPAVNQFSGKIEGEGEAEDKNIGFQKKDRIVNQLKKNIALKRRARYDGKIQVQSINHECAKANYELIPNVQGQRLRMGQYRVMGSRKCC